MAWAKMSLSQAQNIFMPVNINSIVLSNEVTHIRIIMNYDKRLTHSASLNICLILLVALSVVMRLMTGSFESCDHIKKGV